MEKIIIRNIKQINYIKELCKKYNIILEDMDSYILWLVESKQASYCTWNISKMKKLGIQPLEILKLQTLMKY